ncbi:MAG: co-chaperone GroES [Myxococcota bacterium]|jgi:chaperonin GroES|nr:co-chaperone GroES [Myxococcota bacterium]
MALKPLNDRILAQRLEKENVSKGGIIIPDTAKEKGGEARVIAVGPGKRDKEGKHIALTVKAGDRVLFGKYSGSEVKIGSEEYIVLREDDVLAILED